MEAWIGSAITGNLLEVPGIGYATEYKLGFDAEYRESEQIVNTYMLFGKYWYLMLNGHVDEDGNETFWLWLEVKGIKVARLQYY